MTKILLYNVNFKDDMPNITFTPLAFILLEEYLKQNSKNSKILRYDFIVDQKDSKELDNYYTFDIVGFQLTYPNAEIILEMLKKWDQAGNKPFIVLGGVLATAIALKLIEKYSFIDVIVVGEGEHSFFLLTQYINGTKQLSDIPGIVFRNTNNIPVYNKNKEIIDLGKTNIPQRLFFHSLPKSEVQKNSIRIQSARGCLGRCTFCLNSYKNRLDKVTTKVWRGMPPERVIDEIEYLHNEFGVKLINFVDPTFEDPGKKGKLRIERIANLLLEKDIQISFKANIRAETFTDDDIDLLYLLKKAGMDFVVLGVEACTNEELKLLGKNADIDTITRSFYRLSEMNCFTILVGYIPLHPYTTIESLENSYEYLYKLKLSYAYHIFRNVLIPLRGTNIYDKLLEDGFILNSDDLIAVPRFKFKDKQVSVINDSIQKLKIENPVLSNFHQKTLDAFNIIHRSTNRMFKNMLSTDDEISASFDFYKKSIKDMFSFLCDEYYSFQKEIILMAKDKWDVDTFDNLAKEKIINNTVSQLLILEKKTDQYIDLVNSKGYDVDVFETKSWGSYCQNVQKISTMS